ncbi:hypothetical protein U9M48_013358 [Paspalum notatum var. saurae]|uniref:Integrase catalytic domain-containing protein n=1 Tax=Paspalum notatum var. saurae TaxID=547442 RepID=A0AAQ3SZC7_PASNO
MASSEGILFSRSPPSYSSILVGNGTTIPVIAQGSSLLPTSSSTFSLHNVLVAPSLVHNLLLVRQFTRDNNYSIEFDPFGFSVKDLQTRRETLRCASDGDLYTFPVAASSSAAQAHLAVSPAVWHQRLGHPAPATLATLQNSGVISCNKVDRSICHACQLGKHTRLPFDSSCSCTSVPFVLIHCDVWTSPVASISGCLYYLVLLDDFSHFCWTFPMKRKSEVFQLTPFSLPVKCLQADNGSEFVNNATTSFLASHGTLLRLSCPYTSPQNGKAERIIRTLNNSTYWAEALATATYLLNRHPSSAIANRLPYEVLHGTLPDLEHLRVFGCLCYPNLSGTAKHKLSPRSAAYVFLGYPESHKGYRCLNISSRRVIISRQVVFDEGLLPRHPLHLISFLMQIRLRLRPMWSLSNGCPLPLLLRSLRTWSNRDLLRLRAGLLRRRLPSSRRHLCRLDRHLHRAPTPAVQQAGSAPAPPVQQAGPAPVPASQYGQVYVRRPPAPPSGRFGLVYERRLRPDPPPPPAHVHGPVRTVAHPAAPAGAAPAAAPAAAAQRLLQPLAPPRRPMQGAPPPPTLGRIVTRSQTGSLKPPVVPMNLSATATSASPIPSNYRSALADPNWRAAMTNEYRALMANDIWRLVPRPPGVSVVTSKWLYKHKFHSDGTLARHKARWVVRGFCQQPDVDYDETFSPVVKQATVRVVLSIAVSRTWPIHQLDVKNAFLHGHLTETVYCQQPPRFVDPSAPDHVCLLQKSLYGLKQAPRAWYQRFASYICRLGFVASTSDTSLFVYKDRDSVAYLLLYVDDIVLTTSSTALLRHITERLHTEFAMTDLGDLHHFLGVSITRSSDGLFLS